MHKFLTKNRTSGQTILTVVMWAATISAAIGGTIYTKVSDKFEAQAAINLENERRTTKVETKIDLVDEKLNLLLKANGINPNVVK